MNEEKKFDLASELYDWATGLLNAMIFVVVIFAFVACIFSVSGPSMMNTLIEGDKVVISNLFYTPKRGDIVMFNKPGLESFADKSGIFADPPLVKRVIAVGGDKIDIDFSTGTVYINDEAIEEPYLHETMNLRGDMAFPIVLEKGELFCMGDNRNSSSDSRDSRIGIIDERYVLGKLLFRIWPLNKFGAVS